MSDSEDSLDISSDCVDNSTFIVSADESGHIFDESTITHNSSSPKLKQLETTESLDTTRILNDSTDRESNLTLKKLSLDEPEEELPERDDSTSTEAEILTEELNNLTISIPSQTSSKPMTLKINASSTPNVSRSRIKSDTVHESPYNTRLKAKLMKEKEQRSQSEARTRLAKPM